MSILQSLFFVAAFAVPPVSSCSFSHCISHPGSCIASSLDTQITFLYRTSFIIKGLIIAANCLAPGPLQDVTRTLNTLSKRPLSPSPNSDSTAARVLQGAYYADTAHMTVESW